MKKFKQYMNFMYEIAPPIVILLGSIPEYPAKLPELPSAYRCFTLFLITSTTYSVSE